MEITTKDFGRGSTLITLTNSKGVAISFTNLGARVVDWIVKGKHIVLGFDCAEEYLEKDLYPGATIGRTAGRIKGGKTELGGKAIQLIQNEGKQTLHGGPNSFESKLWQYEIVEFENKVEVKFYLTSNDGENGYPGTLNVCVTHSFDEEGKWEINYEAQSDKDTLFNPTNHVYFNLNGDASKSVANHELKLAASYFLPLDAEIKMPSGKIENIRGTSLDFYSGKEIRKCFENEIEQLKMASGLDHPFLLDEVTLEKEQACLTLDDISVSIYTDRPSIVIFTANFGDLGTIYRGKTQVDHGGITFECQVAPGTEQNSKLGSNILKAGDIYHSTTIYQIN